MFGRGKRRKAKSIDDLDDDLGDDLDLDESDRIPGARSKRRSPADFDPEQLERGIAIELEHTTSRLAARDIAMDHLAERPDYYEALERAGL
jgi:hypothetical protein